MFRISLIRNKTGPVLLRFEGNMTGAWVEEATRVCEPIVSAGEELRVDLADVGYADRSGLELLTVLQRHEAALENCPAFLKAQLQSVEELSLGHATVCAAGG